MRISLSRVKMERVYLEDYDLSYEIVKVITQDENKYRASLLHFLDLYGNVLRKESYFPVDVSHALITVIKRVLEAHRAFQHSLNLTLADPVAVAQVFLKAFQPRRDNLYAVFKEYAQLLPSVEVSFVKCLTTHSDIYDFCLTLRGQDGYVNLLSQPRKRLSTFHRQLTRVSMLADTDEERDLWPTIIEYLEELTTLSDYKMVDALPSVNAGSQLKKYDDKDERKAIKRRCVQSRTRLFQAVATKIYNEEVTYLKSMEKFVNTYEDILHAQCPQQRELFSSFFSLVNSILDIHWVFKIQLYEGDLRKMVGFIHATFCSSKSKFSVTYTDYFRQVEDVSLALIRGFSRPLLYEKLLKARNEDESWESYTFLMSQPKMRLLQLEKDVEDMIILLEGHPERLKMVKVLVSVRSVLQNANPPLQETLSSPSKDMIKRRVKVVKKSSSKRKMNQSVYEIQTGLVKRHRFSSLTNLTGLSGLGLSITK